MRKIRESAAKEQFLGTIILNNPHIQNHTSTTIASVHLKRSSSIQGYPKETKKKGDHAVGRVAVCFLREASDHQERRMICRR